jgi:DNA-3-methyladenine glycosylase I
VSADQRRLSSPVVSDTTDEPIQNDGLIHYDDGTVGCWWAGHDETYRHYHDTEWGRPVHDDVRLFEKLCLEGFQAGLSWITVLRKRDRYRTVFEGFEPERVARFSDADVERLLQDPGIIRHRGKILAAINNAQRCLELIERHGSLDAFIWSFEPSPADRPLVCDHASLTSFTTSGASQALSKELKRQGWKFVGPTTMYAFMQSMGVVNDHIVGCDQRLVCEQL